MGRSRFLASLLAVGIVSLGIGVAIGASAGWFETDVSSPTDDTTKVTAEWGEFLGSPKLELLADGRAAMLLDNFVYKDKRGHLWIAETDLIIDGASIPRVFWSLTGGPFEGKFRNASIIHDAACKRRRESSEVVHLMFYEACRCAGVPELKAKVLYAAVYHFGPMWERRTVAKTRKIVTPDGKEHTMTLKQVVPYSNYAPQPAPDAGTREKLEEFVRQRNPSLEDLRQLEPRNL